MPNRFSGASSFKKLSNGFMSAKDKDQISKYSADVKYLSTGEYLQTKAIQYVREDREIQDINYHLTSAAL